MLGQAGQNRTCCMSNGPEPFRSGGGKCGVHRISDGANPGGGGLQCLAELSGIVPLHLHQQYCFRAGEMEAGPGNSAPLYQVQKRPVQQFDGGRLAGAQGTNRVAQELGGPKRNP